MRKIRWLSILALLANSAYAQLGQSESACQKQWGAPISADSSDTNNRCLSYGEPASLSTKLFFIGSLVRRAIYEKLEFTSSEVDALLRMNSQDCRWDVWTTPGQSGPQANGRQWMRSDEMAMASLSSNQLTIVAAEWNLPRPMVESPAATNEIPSSSNYSTNTVLTETNTVAAESETESSRPAASIRKSLPARLPSRGASRRETIDILGSPSGTITSGSREVLVYPWGKVWLTNGSVAVTE
jgi:hypothetical protein